MSKKPDTFNQLDERFQLQPHHDANHIFPEEYELIKELRKERPELEKESDKFLVTFLCARRHKLEETLGLLDTFIAKRKELGFDNVPNLKSETLRKHLEAGVILRPKGAVDKHDRLLHYVWVAKDKPKERPINTLYEYGFWETYYQIATETLKTIRNGSIMVIDFKGFGLSNVDLSPKGIEFSKALSGVFPKRIRKVYLINGGWLLKLISEGAKLVLSRKLSERVEVGSVEGLRNMVPEDFLLSDYGGKCTTTLKDWMDDIKKDEDKWELAAKYEQYERANSQKDLKKEISGNAKSFSVAAEN